MIVSDIKRLKEVLDKMLKPFVLITFVFDEKIIGMVVFQ